MNIQSVTTKELVKVKKMSDLNQLSPEELLTMAKSRKATLDAALAKEKLNPMSLFILANIVLVVSTLGLQSFHISNGFITFIVAILGMFGFFYFAQKAVEVYSITTESQQISKVFNL